MKKVLLYLLINISFLFNANLALAQAPEPDNVAFIYATGERSDGKLKVLIIGTHIMGFKGLNTPLNDNVEVKYALGFRKLLEDIEHKERVSHLADYHNIQFNSPVVEDITSNIHPETSKTYGIGSNDSKLTAIEKIRKGVLDEYGAKGYKIYQVSFNPTDYEDFQQFKDNNWIPYEYVRRSAISPLWIAYYQQGEIRSMLTSLGSYDNTGSGGITVESTSKAKTETQTTTSDDPDKWQRRAALSKYQAGLFESEANRLYDLGISYYPQALDKYKEAYKLYPSAHSKQRIEYIESMTALTQYAGESVVGITNFFDEANIPEFMGWQLSYTGYPDVEATSGIVSKPYNVELLLSNYRIIAYNLGFTYNNSPIYQYTLQDQYLKPANVAPLQFTLQGFGMQGAIGLGIPIKFFALYGLFGTNFMLSQKYTIINSEYTAAQDFEKTFKNSLYPFRRVGLHIKIPKTKIAIGAHYTMRKIKSEKILILGDVNSEIRFNGEKYFLLQSLDEIYQYNQFGASLSFVF